MRTLIQLSFFATVVFATASSADADSPHRRGNGPHTRQTQRYDEDRGHGNHKGHGQDDDRDRLDARQQDARQQEERRAALRDDWHDLKQISRVCREWERFSHSGDYRKLNDTRRRLQVWLQQEIAESRRQLRAAELELREAERWGKAPASYAAVYHPHGDIRGYVRYSPGSQVQRRQVTRARQDLLRLQKISAQLRISRVGTGHSDRLAVDAALVHELVRMSSESWRAARRRYRVTPCRFGTRGTEWPPRNRVCEQAQPGKKQHPALFAGLHS